MEEMTVEELDALINEKIAQKHQIREELKVLVKARDIQVKKEETKKKIEAMSGEEKEIIKEILLQSSGIPPAEKFGIL